MTEYVLGKLREAFLLGCTDTEACCLADINPDTLYTYQKENPDYVAQKNKWKEMPFILARTAIINGFSEKDGGNLAIKYLERKKKDEFSVRQEVTGKDGEKLNVGIVQLPLRTKGPAGGNDKG